METEIWTLAAGIWANAATIVAPICIVFALGNRFLGTILGAIEGRGIRF